MLSIQPLATAQDALALMDGELSDKDFMTGNDATLADIALFPYTHVAEEGGFDLAAYPAVQSWLERVPTYKDQQEALKEKDLATYGFLGYPLLQSADILVYRAGMVPVGEDQRQHLELSRDIATKFNLDFNAPDFFPLPEPVIEKTYDAFRGKTAPKYGDKSTAQWHFEALKRILDRKESDYAD